MDKPINIVGPQLALAKTPLLGAEGTQKWIEILRTGNFLGHKEPFSIEATDLESMVSNYSKQNHLPVYIGHPVSEVPAVGWILDLKTQDEKLLALVEFAPDTASKIKKGSYKFCSIEGKLNALDIETGEPVGAMLEALGLTNQPVVQGLQPIHLSRRDKRGTQAYLRLTQDSTTMDLETLKAELEALIAEADEATLQALLDAAKGGSEEPAEGDAPDEGDVALAEGGSALLEAVRSATGNPELTEEEAIALVTEALAASSDEAEAEPVALSKLRSEVKSATSAIKLLKDRNLQLSKQVGAFQDASINNTVDALIENGTIEAAKRDAYVKLAKTAPDTFKALTDTDVKAVNLGKVFGGASVTDIKQAPSAFALRLKAMAKGNK